MGNHEHVGNIYNICGDIDGDIYMMPPQSWYDDEFDG